MRSLWETLWSLDQDSLPKGRRVALGAVRVAMTVGRDLADGQLSLRAMGLVYTTLLSLVPLLAVSFSVLQAFGVHNELDGWLVSMLAPLGEEALRVANQILTFVENVNVKVLGTFGLGVLIYTVISLTQKVESAVNYTWRIRGTRSFFERFTRYLSVIVIGPLLVVSAMGLYATVMTSELVSDMMALGGLVELRARAAKAVPYLMIMAAFTFVYIYIPNARVRVRAALTGGVVAGLLWSVAGAAFARFAVGATAYAAIYSSFAIIVLFLIWLYVGWLVLLIGAAVSFYTQYPEYHGTSPDRSNIGTALFERIGLEVACRIARNFVVGAEPWALGRLGAFLNVPLENVREVTERLVAGGILVVVDGNEDTYVPARDLATLTVADVLRELRSTDDTRKMSAIYMRHNPTVEDTANRVEHAIAESVGGMSLRDFALAAEGEDTTRGGQRETPVAAITARN